MRSIALVFEKKVKGLRLGVKTRDPLGSNDVLLVLVMFMTSKRTRFWESTPHGCVCHPCSCKDQTMAELDMSGHTICTIV